MQDNAAIGLLTTPERTRRARLLQEPIAQAKDAIYDMEDWPSSRHMREARQAMLDLIQIIDSINPPAKSQE